MQNSQTQKYPKFLFQIKDIEKPERFNSRQFGPYEDRNGRVVNLIDANGRTLVGGYTTSRAVEVFDVSSIKNAEIVRFLQGHPDNKENGGSGFTLIDSEKEKSEEVNHLMEEIDVQESIMKLESKKLRAVASKLGLNRKGTIKEVRASVITVLRSKTKVNDKPVYGYLKVKKAIEDKNTIALLEVTQMLEEGIISLNTSGLYVFKSHTLGVNLEQVADYFDRNKPLYGELKKLLRMALNEKGELNEEGTDLTEGLE